MALRAPDTTVELRCDRCGYDLRAQRDDALCPECGTSVAVSRQLAACPRRPAWRDSDRRWRRRMLAGVWIFALLPLANVLRATGWAAAIPVHSFFNPRGTLATLDDTLLLSDWVCPSLVLEIGALVMIGISALFFSMPPRYRPTHTTLFIDVCAAYRRYGPQPSN